VFGGFFRERRDKRLKTMTLRSYSIVFFAIFVFFSVCRSYGGDCTQDEITVVLPGPAVSKVFSELLPMRIDPHGRMTGDLSIKSIRNLRFDKDKVLCSIRFLGKETKYTMPLRKTASVVIDIGDLDVYFDLEGTLRFDPGTHRLYVKPTIVGDVQGIAEGSPLSLLLALLTDIEYPIHMQRLLPVTTGTEGRPVQIDLSISDVSSENNRLVLTVQPKVVKTGP